MTDKIDPDTPGCDGGLPLEKRLDRNNRPTTETPEKHQLWVWMNGMNPPRWEIRGTGLVLPEGWPTRHGPFRREGHLDL